MVEAPKVAPVKDDYIQDWSSEMAPTPAAVPDVSLEKVPPEFVSTDKFAALSVVGTFFPRNVVCEICLIWLEIAHVAFMKKSGTN